MYSIDNLENASIVSHEIFMEDTIKKISRERSLLPVLPEDMEYRVHAEPYVYDKETDSYSFVVHYVPTFKVGTIHNPAPPQD